MVSRFQVLDSGIFFVRGTCIPDSSRSRDSELLSCIMILDSKSKFVADCRTWILLDEVKKKCVNRGSGKKFPCSGTTNFLVDCD